MKVVQKYNLAAPMRQIVHRIPSGAKFLTIHQHKPNEPYMYFEVEQTSPLKDHEFIMVATYAEIPSSAYEYIGSACFDRNELLHIYML